MHTKIRTIFTSGCIILMCLLSMAFRDSLPFPEIIIHTVTPHSTMTPHLTATEIVFLQTPTLISVSRLPVSSQYEVMFVSQGGLKYRGELTAAGCTAASAQMVLDFWHQQDQTFPTMTAQQLIDLNSAQRTFHGGTGLSIVDIEDELATLNYDLLIAQNSDKASLLEALARLGPQIVLVKNRWVPDGANHLVVVTGYDAEEDWLTIHDPWQKVPIFLTWDAFDGIWGLNYSVEKDGYLVQSFFTIIPKSVWGE